MVLLAVWQHIDLYRNVIPPSQILEDEAECHRRGFYSSCECSVTFLQRVNEQHKGGASKSTLVTTE